MNLKRVDALLYMFKNIYTLLIQKLLHVKKYSIDFYKHTLSSHLLSDKHFLDEYAVLLGFGLLDSKTSHENFPEKTLKHLGLLFPT